ncbi:MAG: 50S ribosomal protein L3 [Candidatus Woesearchaeota archaeon]
MPKPAQPRHGSMQVWPRVRARRSYARVRTWNTKNPGPAGFPGYKAGMTHVMATDGRKNSPMKGETLAIPVTVIECPPLKVAGVRFYKNSIPSLDIHFKPSKDVLRKVNLKQKGDLSKVNAAEYEDVVLIIHTQPALAGIKKKPELFEIPMGGSMEEKIKYAQEHQEITVQDALKESSLVDFHAITTGRGFQGPVKRFGVSIRHHKSEKTKRGPGSLGAWYGQAHMMYRVAHAGQMGYHQRTQYNNLILKIGTKGEEVTPKGGFIRYGVVKNPYVLIKGSIPGPKKRMVIMAQALRPTEAPEQYTIDSISTRSKQG